MASCLDQVWRASCAAGLSRARRVLGVRARRTRLSSGSAAAWFQRRTGSESTGGRPAPHRRPEDERWAEVARLLSRKHDALPPLQALELLPGRVALGAALPFLEGALRGAGERRRAASVAKNLRRSEQVGLLGEEMECRQRAITVTPERACSLCFKRVGSAAFVALPSGMLRHYSCHRRAAANGGGGGAEALPMHGQAIRY